MPKDGIRQPETALRLDKITGQRWTGPWVSCLSSSCFPGVWMCVAPPSCLNRSLLKELARLPTNPLIPLQWGKAQKKKKKQSGGASSQVYVNISQPRGRERTNTSSGGKSHHQHFHSRTEWGKGTQTFRACFITTERGPFYYFSLHFFSRWQIQWKTERAG